MKAFPVEGIELVQEGMDLRDYFAAKAMQGFIASPAGKAPHQTDIYVVAQNSYEMADAMMIAREQA